MSFETQFTLRGLVVHNISVISGYPEAKLTDALRLSDIMTDEQRAALAPGFQKIARQYSAYAVFQQRARLDQSQCICAASKPGQETITQRCVSQLDEASA